MNDVEKIELIKTGAVQIYTEQGLADRFRSGKRLTFKLGADPRRPDLHLIDGVMVEDPMFKISVTEPFVIQFGKNKI